MRAANVRWSRERAFLKAVNFFAVIIAPMPALPLARIAIAGMTIAANQ